jgi:hypothetical protein
MIKASPIFFRAAMLFGAAFIATYALTFVDVRLLNGVSVWEKPSKFFFSLGLHMATLAWGVSLLPEPLQHAKSIKRASYAFMAAAVFEMAYMLLQSARGEASHFNTSDTFHAIMYAVMGVGSLTLVGVTAYLGWRIRVSATSLIQFAAGWSFITAAVTTTIVAGYMSSSPGHWVGGELTDASGLPFFHWSTTGGDLRVPHFAALHIMQAVPLVAWFWPNKRLTQAALAAGVFVVAALFAQSIMGVPIFRV